MAGFGAWGNPDGGFNWDMLTNVGAGMLANSQYDPATAFGKGYNQASQNAMEQAKTGLVFQEMEQKRKQQQIHDRALQALIHSGLLGAQPQPAPTTGAQLQPPMQAPMQDPGANYVGGQSAPAPMAQAPQPQAPAAPQQLDANMYNQLVDQAAKLKAVGEDDMAAGLMQRAQAMVTLQHQGTEQAQLGIQQNEFGLHKQQNQFTQMNENRKFTADQEKQFQELYGKPSREQLKGYNEAGLQGQERTQNADRLLQLLNDKNTYTGTGSHQLLELKRLGQAAGVQGLEGVANTEEAQAIMRKDVIARLGGSLGNRISDSDRKFAETTGASMDTSKEGNQRLATVMKKLGERDVEVADAARKYYKEHKQLDTGWDEELARIKSKNLFPETTPTSGVQGGGSTTPNPSNAPTKRYNQQTGKFEVIGQ